MQKKKAEIHLVQNSEQRDFDGGFETPDSDVCPICFGIGMEIVPGKGARVCECRKQGSHSNLLNKANIPRRYDDKHFQNYFLIDNPQIRAHEIASKFAMDYCKSKHENKPEIMPEKGLLFIGPVGVGKTHLAVSILKMVIEREYTGLFYEFGALLKDIQDSYNPTTHTSELKVLAPVLEAEILVLDEIGASKPTNWVQDTLGYIINSRYNEKKLTIFTTNYLDERASDSEETLQDRIGVRLRSRLFEMCKTVMITGKDFRRLSQNAHIKKA